MVKSVADLVREAEAGIAIVSVEEARALHGQEGVVFLDVREPQEVERGRIAGALAVPRGLLEFAADPSSRSHRRELAEASRVIVYCGSGARSALAARSLKEMGIPVAANLKGGFSAWRDAGGEVES
jgi:rhodanese-related sulfurtransferase